MKDNNEPKFSDYAEAFKHMGERRGSPWPWVIGALAVLAAVTALLVCVCLM